MGKKSGLVGVAVLLLPIIEVVALVVVGGALGLGRTIVLFVLLSFAGASLFRYRLAGLAGATARSGTDLASLPRALGSSVVALIGAGLIMLPGFVTAVLGAVLQIGPVRSLLAHRVSGNVTTSMGGLGGRFGMANPFGPVSRARGDVIDTDLTDTDPTNTPAGGPRNRPSSFPSTTELN